MINLLSFIVPICLACLWFFHHKSYKKIEVYIIKHYPQEWHHASLNHIDTSYPKARRRYLKASIKDGFLSGQNDPMVINYNKLTKTILIVSSLILIMQLIWVYSLFYK